MKWDVQVAATEYGGLRIAVVINCVEHRDQKNGVSVVKCHLIYTFLRRVRKIAKSDYWRFLNISHGAGRRR